jgi:hypothetical protein
MFQNVINTLRNAVLKNIKRAGYLCSNGPRTYSEDNEFETPNLTQFFHTNVEISK